MYVQQVYYVEWTRSQKIENDLNYNERSSLIPDYLVLTR